MDIVHSALSILDLALTTLYREATRLTVASPTTTSHPHLSKPLQVAYDSFIVIFSFALLVFSLSANSLLDKELISSCGFQSP
jgi:hypothetical protein